MAAGPLPKLRDALTDVVTRLRGLTGKHDAVAGATANILSEIAAVQYHAGRIGTDPVPHLVLLGGTGAGKSTLVNRLCNAKDDEPLTATSFRRTFTAGCVAVTGPDTPADPLFLGIEHRAIPNGERPARGTADVLAVVRDDAALPGAVLVDSPDLDGDLPEHHRQADRAFRWADAIVLVATPEKYQLPEMPTYARLAMRYGVPRLFVLNKADDADAPADWTRQLTELGEAEPALFVMPRDGSSLAIPEGGDLAGLRDRLPRVQHDQAWTDGLLVRGSDLAGRIQDQVLSPLRRERASVDAAKKRLRAIVSPQTDVNVNPMTRHLQRRLQQQSVLYLMGPARIFDRIKSVPNFVARLPRNAWDLVSGGNKNATGEDAPPSENTGVPDFRGELIDGFRLVQSRVADVLHETDLTGDAWKMNADAAGDIATEELGALQKWLEERWNAKPRDTRVLEKMFKFIPGSQHLTKMSESAPYLLTAVCAATSASIGHIDQVVIGGYLLTTWLGEKLSNEVTARTREANRRIDERFGELSRDQVQAAIDWLEARVPTTKQLADIEASAANLAEVQ